MYDGHTSIKKGIFVPIDADIDGFALLQVQCSSLVYSYGTVLYVWGLTDIIPHTFHISVPQGENISRLVRDNQKIKAHYVMKGFYNLGITETQSPQGAVIRLHDKERCLCDLIKDRSQIEKQLYVQAIRDYFKSQPDIRKLLKYGKAFGIKKQLCGDFFLPGNRYTGNMQDRYGRIIFAGRDRHT